MHGMLVQFSADDILKYFSQEIDFDMSCKLSPEETFCMKWKKIYFLKKNIKK